MMKKIHGQLCHYLILILLLNSSCLSQQQDRYDEYIGTKPLAILIESRPWLIGTDMPRVALYDDGTLIYLKRNEKNDYFYVRKILDRESLKKLQMSLRLTDNFVKLKYFYRLIHITDFITVQIYLSDGSRSKTVSVYGMVPETEKRPVTWWVPEKIQKPDKLPGEFEYLYDIMINISYENTEIWIPEYIEILIWPYEYAPEEESLNWLKNWPSLSHPLTRRYGDSYSLYISGTELDNLKNFLSKQKQGQAVLIDGKKWSVSYRFVFPNEFIWQKAFCKNK